MTQKYFLEFSAPQCFVLDDCAVIELRGPDAGTWLQGQTTNDVLALAGAQSVYSLFVTTQGRVIADAWIGKRGDNYLLIVPNAATPALLERFERYIVMEDVTVVPSDALIAHVSGKGCEAIANDFQDRALIAPRLGQTGYDILIAREDTQTLQELVKRCEALGGAELSSNEFEATCIRNTVPRFGVDFSTENFPQEAGLAARAVSFTKGCYLGQEPVAMLQHRGKTKKQLALLRLDTRTQIAPSAELQTAEGKTAGKITSAHVYPDLNRTLALGYVQRTAIASNAALSALGTSAHIEQLLGA